MDLFTEYAHCNYLLKSVSFLKGTETAESLDFLTKFLKLPVGSNAHAWVMTERSDGLWEPEWDKSEGCAAIMNRNERLLSNFASPVRSEILLMNFILSEQYVSKAWVRLRKKQWKNNY